MHSLFEVFQRQIAQNSPFFPRSHGVTSVAGQVCRLRPSFTSSNTAYSWRKQLFQKVICSKGVLET